MMPKSKRPLSPHLDIYRFRITMIASLLHRASGSFLSLGLFILVIKLTTISIYGGADFSPSGIFLNIFWFVWSMAVYYHLCNGIRHLIWDVGYGFELKTANKTAKLVVIGTVILTSITWLPVVI